MYFFKTNVNRCFFLIYGFPKQIPKRLIVNKEANVKTTQRKVLKPFAFSVSFLKCSTILTYLFFRKNKTIFRIKTKIIAEAKTKGLTIGSLTTNLEMIQNAVDTSKNTTMLIIIIPVILADLRLLFGYELLFSTISPNLKKK